MGTKNGRLISVLSAVVSAIFKHKTVSGERNRKVPLHPHNIDPYNNRNKRKGGNL